jgi:hypothetical protein
LSKKKIGLFHIANNNRNIQVETLERQALEKTLKLERLKKDAMEIAIGF